MAASEKTISELLAQNADFALVSRKQLAEHFGITPQGWDMWVRRGRAPKKVTPDGMFPRWRLSDIKEMLERQTVQDVKPDAEKSNES